MNEIKTDLHTIGSRFLGLKEVAGSVNNPQIMAMLQLDNKWPSGDEVPWCSAFVNYCAFLLGLPRSKSLSARSWLTVGEGIDPNFAHKGCDIVVFSRGDNPTSGHVAIFDSHVGMSLNVLGGNQGDTVSIAPYSVSRVLGVRRLA